MYANKITLLQNGYTAAIPGSKYQAITYIGNKKLITDPLLLAVSGKIVVQYTPYEGTGPGCARYAAVKVWAEDNYNPVIEKTWTPLPSQEIAEQKRDSCEFSCRCSLIPDLPTKVTRRGKSGGLAPNGSLDSAFNVLLDERAALSGSQSRKWHVRYTGCRVKSLKFGTVFAALATALPKTFVPS